MILKNGGIPEPNPRSTDSESPGGGGEEGRGIRRTLYLSKFGKTESRMLIM